ncbi:fumarylacetoacetate hydrolase family protein [Thermomonospora umbrina]|uniref:2-keto-4-pentenoate hydratase/2-oxohepta-3-ene-1,7-dioic acid hydratase in catechol pathway n=1 Tax=Thermomonospora umbrina TaxID=111806 RepID=A0A3D9SMC6_9ACTN|nr:fumarylacetoacetate hydrolase family protein [Thermomonospora umbrina]REE95083.1 2-keto-4-pentenoate hydratase/2-oxohepta-3-ene-1,7-dioic acid hydratase in catechol pathway [Thermomonospora umbrina]
MKLVSYDDGRAGALRGDRVVDLGGRTVHDLIDAGGPPPAPDPGDPGLPLERVRLRVPIPRPSKIIAAPVNYRDHQAEMSVDSQVGTLGFFLKAPSSLLDPGGTVRLPYHDRRFDQEGELALVIGRTARRVNEADALSYVFGYTGLLDITMRGGEDRSTRKSFETFTPMGPVLVTADEFGDPDDVDLRCRVNDDLRQAANTRDLIWSVARLVSYASWVTTLHPGDVITTGTPAGVGPLGHGDTVRLRLSGIDLDLTVTVSADAAVASHTAGRDRGPVPPPPTSGDAR